MKLRARAKEEPEVNLTSLIDVVLLLLVFFMVSTSFVREAEIALRLPEAGRTAQPVAEREELEIVVSAGGEYRVNGRALVDSRSITLQRAVQEVAGSQAGMPVVIRADAEARHQAVVTAMDVLGRMGHSDVRIATMEDPQAGRE